MKTSIRKEQGGIPKGGSTNQALEKTSGADYVVAWEDVSGGIGGAGAYKSGTVTPTVSAPTVIAHGLGVAPTFVRMSAFYNGTPGSPNTTGTMPLSIGTWDGTNYSTVYVLHNATGGGAQLPALDTAAIVHIDASSGIISTGTITVDDTNITITWSNSGGGVSPIRLLWEAVAGGAGSDKKVGVGHNTDIGWFNTQLQFMGDHGTSSENWNIWNFNAMSASQASTVHTQFSTNDHFGNNTGDYTSMLPDFSVAAGEYRFDSTKQMIFQIQVVANAASANNNLAGFGCEVFGGTQLRDAQGTAVPYGFGFVRKDSDGQWSTYCSNGVTATANNISVADGVHTFRCEFDPSNGTPQVRYYLDGVLVDTITTNLPNQANPLGFSIGNGTAVGSQGILGSGVPSFSVEI